MRVNVGVCWVEVGWVKGTTAKNILVAVYGKDTCVCNHCEEGPLPQGVHCMPFSNDSAAAGKARHSAETAETCSNTGSTPALV